MLKYIYPLFLLVLMLAAQENYKLVKIYIDQTADLEKIENAGIAADHVRFEKDGSVSLFVPVSKMSRLSSLGFNYEIVIDDWYEHYKNRPKLSKQDKASVLNSIQTKYNITNFGYGSMGGFYTLSEVMTELQLLRLDYGNLISEPDTIGYSIENRPIVAVKISDNPNVNEDEPEVLYTALHHAREPESMMQLLFFINYLTENYGTDDEVTYLVDNREMYFIPVVNPDGYYENERTNPDGGGMWRRNKRNGYGVDLNRNYGPYEYWDAANGGSSTDTNSDTYRGTVPFSEPETAAIRDFLNYHDIKACLNYHSFGNLLITPYGALEKETSDSTTFREFGSDMTYYNNYLFGTDQQTVGYSTRGNSDDYMYDGEPGRDKIFTMTPEVGPWFWPEVSEIIPLAEENLFPNLYYARIVGGFPEVTSFKMSKEFINPGDHFSIMPVVKNKGLSSAEDLEIKINSLSENLTVISDNALLIESLEARETLSLQSGLIMSVDESSHPGEELFFSFEVVEKGFTVSSDTFNIRIGEPVVLFNDFADSLETYWQTNNIIGTYGKWFSTKESFYSRPSSYTDSKNRNYLFNTDVYLKSKEYIDLSNKDNALLSFYTRHITEPVYDVGFVEISVDSGTTWQKLRGKISRNSKSGKAGKYQTGDPVYFGPRYDWVKEEIDLTPFCGSDILLKFTFVSDQAVEMDGWYIDNISVTSYDVTTNIADEKKELKFALRQNYPNPFNPATVIGFQLPAAGKVNLKIYDLLGREVTTLLSEEKPAGSHEIVFNAAHLPSGVYFYKLKAGQYSSVKKLLLLK